MKKFAPLFLMLVQPGSAVTVSFTGVAITFDGAQLNAISTPGEIGSCDDLHHICPAGDLSITGLVLNGPVITIGDYRSQLLADGEINIDVPGEEPLVGRFLDASLTRSADESFFGFVEISSPIWWERLGTSFLGVNISLPGSMNFSGHGLEPFSATTHVIAYTMIEDPGQSTPEPGTYSLLGAGLLSYAVFRGYRRLSLRSGF
jgi:hypothetical protein